MELASQQIVKTGTKKIIKHAIIEIYMVGQHIAETGAKINK